MGYTNIGPAYWKGEEGRKALIDGSAKLTDAAYVEPFEVIARWKPYLGDGFEAQTYPDSQNLFTLGRAAIYPTGSWEISPFGKDATFEMGAFKPPVKNAGDKCYITDHVDHRHGHQRREPEQGGGQGLRPVGRHARSSPSSTATRCRASSRCPRSRSSSRTRWPGVREPGASECEATIRLPYQIISRGTPNLVERDVGGLGQRDQRHPDARRTPRPSSRRASPPGTRRSRSSRWTGRPAGRPRPDPVERSATMPDKTSPSMPAERWPRRAGGRRPAAPAAARVPLAHRRVPGPGGDHLHAGDDPAARRDPAAVVLQPRRRRAASSSSACRTSLSCSSTSAGPGSSGTRSGTTSISS